MFKKYHVLENSLITQQLSFPQPLHQQVLVKISLK